ncbi:unnamed protein product [Echinostoma caproni]|uniref:Tetraspanin n=1 Tax=Echinostoma caproni TaxID=27848 RepID=A0A183A6H3_9TREM|nr:unnamed protein product [Echinostoma caproni]
MMLVQHPIGAALFGIGIVLFVFAILAFVGVCCNLSIFLIIYAILLGVLIIAHTIFLIIYFLKKDVVLGYVRRLLEKQTLLYKSLESKDPDSVLLGALMTTLHCCGYNNGSDFYKEGAQFTHRDSYDGREFINISYPLPCCNSKESKKLLASYIQGGGKPVTSVPLMCPYVFTEENSHYNIGCRETVEKELVKICDFAAYVSIGPLLLEVILFILAVAIVILRKKE